MALFWARFTKSGPQFFFLTFYTTDRGKNIIYDMDTGTPSGIKVDMQFLML
jgi:hypothetical protein